MMIFNQNKAKKALAILMPIIFLGALNFCLMHPNAASAQSDLAPVVSSSSVGPDNCHGEIDVNSDSQQSPEKNSDASAPFENSSLFCCVVHDSAKTESGSQNQEFSGFLQMPEVGNFSFNSLEVSNDSLNLYLLALSPPEPDLLASVLKKE